ncbi:MAG: hypothetical protein GWP91_24130 [Rhodobacterales bacterium]|nr:hypothetical protein [Rhodobacterales bacterium]
MRNLTMLFLVGCAGDYAIHKPPVVPPAQPPGLPDQDWGGPPDWQNCQEGFLGRYSNLAFDHPDVEPGLDAEIPDDPNARDWWDNPSFQKYDGGLDFGGNWWPVDEGLQADPAYYSVHWVAWLRAFDDTPLEFVLGASDDAWVSLDDDILAAQPGVHEMASITYNVDVRSGQFPLVIRYAHRAGDSGFRFRVLSGDVAICYPDFSEDEE